MSNIQPTEEHIRLKLVSLVQAIMKSETSYEDRMKYVMFVSIADSILYEEAIDRGESGYTLRDIYMTEGLIWVHPFFYGHTVFWYASETKFCHVSDLSREELLAVIDKQSEYLKKAYDNRQRL